jgi:DNA ligase-1
MKPMLACDHDPDKLRFPLFASPKLDGLRGLVHEGKLLSRSLKPIPNRHVSKILSDPIFNGLDGELIAGSPTAHNCMQACTSFFMAQDKVSDDWSFRVFDLHDRTESYDVRVELLADRVLAPVSHHIVLHTSAVISDHDELLAYEAEQLAAGYEGLILRCPNSPYKFGRSTVKEGYLLKVKRFVDNEAVILGFEEQMFNGNEATTNELGRTKRSSHKAGLVGKDTLGALLVRDLKTDVEFSIGTGLDDAVRRHIWGTRDEHLGKLVKYKSFPIGVKDAPRHPVFLGFRDARDMS